MRLCASGHGGSGVRRWYGATTRETQYASKRPRHAVSDGATSKGGDDTGERERAKSEGRGRGGCGASPDASGAPRWQAGGGQGRRAGDRQQPACSGKGRKTIGSPRWAGLALPSWAATVVGRLGRQVSSLSFSFITYFLFFCNFVALLKISRHFQKSPNCACPMFRIYPTWNILVWDYLDI